MINSDWQNFLNDSGAHLDERGVRDFEGSTCSDDAENKLFDLSDIGVVKISGEDAPGFLQGQFSNDVSKLDGSNSQLSSYCTPKGRILACFRLFRDGDNFYMLIPSETLPATQKRLQMFVLMSKVTISDISSDVVRMGTFGQQLANRLSEQFGQLPNAENGFCSVNGVQVLRLAGNEPRLFVIGEPAKLRPIWESANDGITRCGYPGWDLLDIRAGTPSVLTETVEAFVPQMINLHAIDGVSFSKGCYPGQEIVARMHYLGKLKRRMYRAEIETSNIPKPGTPLVSAHSDSGQGAGQVVSSAQTSADSCEILAVVQVSAFEAGDLRLENDTGPVLNFLDIPYEVPLEREK